MNENVGKSYNNKFQTTAQHKRTSDKTELRHRINLRKIGMTKY